MPSAMSVLPLQRLPCSKAESGFNLVCVACRLTAAQVNRVMHICHVRLVLLGHIGAG